MQMQNHIPCTISQRDPHPFTVLDHVARILTPDRPPVEVGALLEYSVEEPFAVVLELHLGASVTCWTLSRELLARGVREHDGQGEVAAWPVMTPGGSHLVRLRLGPVEACAVLEFEHQVLASWLESTFDLVPAGTEARHVNWDETIARLLRAEC